MNYETIYSVINLAVLPAWALLVFAPRWRATRAIVHSFVYPVIYGFLYLAFLSAALFFGQGAEGAGMGDIAGVSAIFSKPVGVLTGWSHYLVFDLFVGAWIARDARAHAIQHILVVPALLLTLMFGPTGLLLYLTIRFFIKGGATSLDEQDRYKGSS